MFTRSNASSFCIRQCLPNLTSTILSFWFPARCSSCTCELLVSRPRCGNLSLNVYCHYICFCYKSLVHLLPHPESTGHFLFWFPCFSRIRTVSPPKTCKATNFPSPSVCRLVHCFESTRQFLPIYPEGRFWLIFALRNRFPSFVLFRFMVIYMKVKF